MKSSRMAAIALACLAASAVPSTSFAHTLVADHVPPAAALEGAPLDLHVAVASSCIVLCGWVHADLHYWTPDGTEHSLSRDVPYGHVATVRLTVPGNHVAGNARGRIPVPVLTYTVTVTQDDCLSPCHSETVHLPRVKGARYVVPIASRPQG